MELDGIGAFVTGGASGLGEATARLLHARGARVCIYDLPRSQGARVAESLGAAAHFLPGDVCDEGQVAEALDETVKRLGGLRALVNCAGIGSAARTVSRKGEPFPLEMFERTVRVNLIGGFNVIRLAAARMLGNEPGEHGERGAMVNTASVAAFEGQIGQAAYAASKGGVVSMTLPIARDLARHGIRLCSIAPGLFKTPMLMSLPDPVLEALGASVPFPARLGEPHEYAQLACQILENPMLNGETIRLDGAIRMAPE